MQNNSIHDVSVKSAFGGSHTPIELRILDAGPARPSCVEKDSKMFLTRLKSTSTGASSSSLPWTSLTAPPFLLSEVPCDLASKDEAPLCGKTKNMN